MRHLSRLANFLAICSALPFLLGATPARSGESDNICAFYASVGATTAAFMLPRTFGDVMAMLSGKNPKMMAEYTDALLKATNSAELNSVQILEKADIDVLGKASAQTVFQLLFSGSATTAEEAEAQLMKGCKSIGYQTIIANQKTADALTSQNIVKE